MYIKNNIRIFLISLASLCGVVCAGYILYVRFSAENNIVFFEKKIRPQHAYVSPLDGEPVSSSAETAVQVVGVMIDNHRDARPQSGVSYAKIVYEVLVEGGITRYFAIFDNTQSVTEVGPVRSARLYFLDWLQEYGNAMYMHSGGSPQALAAIKPRKIFDANEFFFGAYFWRGTYHLPPHNLYTSSDKWQKITEKYGTTTSLFTADQSWKFASELGDSLSNTSTVAIRYNSFYNVTWTYDPGSLLYERVVNNRLEKNKDADQITARNLIIQFTVVGDISGDDKGRQEIKTVGSGEAIVLRKGEAVRGVWKKDGIKNRTRFYTSEGDEIVLAPGNTWVEVVPADTDVEVK